MDEEKNKYLIFKNISGFDAVPRIREPTPEKNKMGSVDELLNSADNNCDKCGTLRDKYRSVKLENEELKL